MATVEPGDSCISIHKRGNAVFIINEEKSDKTDEDDFETRKGAKCDSENLHAVFVHKLGFKLMNAGAQLNMNLTIDKWDHNKPVKREIPSGHTCNCLCCRIKSTDHSNSSCFVLAVSSHGRTLKKGPVVFFVDGQHLLVSEMMAALSDENCPTLKGKPRIMIMQMCRTSSDEDPDDRGAPILVSKLTKHSQPSGDQSTDANDPGRFTVTPVDEEHDFALTTILNEFLMVYASVKGKRAKRNIETGSWMLNELKNVTDRYDVDKEPVNILKIFTEVNRNVSRLETTVNKKDDKGELVRDEKKSGLKSSICIEHKLTEPLIFYPLAKEKTTQDIPLPDFFGGKKKKQPKK